MHGSATQITLVCWLFVTRWPKPARWSSSPEFKRYVSPGRAGRTCTLCSGCRQILPYNAAAIAINHHAEHHKVTRRPASNKNKITLSLTEPLMVSILFTVLPQTHRLTVVCSNSFRFFCSTSIFCFNLNFIIYSCFPSFCRLHHAPLSVCTLFLFYSDVA